MVGTDTLDANSTFAGETKGVMMMYEELTQRLRETSMDFGEADHVSVMLLEAADAIEELTKKEKFHAFLWNTIQPNEMELYIDMYRAQAIPQEPPKEEI